MTSGFITTNLDGHLFPDWNSHFHLFPLFVSSLDIMEKSHEDLRAWLFLPQLLFPQLFPHILLGPLHWLPVICQVVGHLSADGLDARVKPLLVVLANKLVGYLVFIISFYTFCLSMTENGTFSKSSEETLGNVLLSAVFISFQYPFGEFFGSSYPTSIR